MSHQQNQVVNSEAPDSLPAKRKRGRPRKDERTIQGERASNMSGSDIVKRNRSRRIDPHPFLANVMVGQVVSGVLDGKFDAGYLLTVRVGDSNTVLRGVVFEPGLSVPVSGANDVAPHLKMLKRNEAPLPVVPLQTQVHGSNREAELSVEPSHRNVDPHPLKVSPPTKQVPGADTHVQTAVALKENEAAPLSELPPNIGAVTKSTKLEPVEILLPSESSQQVDQAGSEALNFESKSDQQNAEASKDHEIEINHNTVATAPEVISCQASKIAHENPVIQSSDALLERNSGIPVETPRADETSLPNERQSVEVTKGNLQPEPRTNQQVELMHGMANGTRPYEAVKVTESNQPSQPRTSPQAEMLQPIATEGKLYDSEDEDTMLSEDVSESETSEADEEATESDQSDESEPRTTEQVESVEEISVQEKLNDTGNEHIMLWKDVPDSQNPESNEQVRALEQSQSNPIDSNAYTDPVRGADEKPVE